MKTLIAVLLLTLAACGETPEPVSPTAMAQTPVDDPEVARADVGRVLDAFHLAASRADGPAYFALFAPEGVFIGTDAAERWRVPEFRAYAEPHFAKGKGWTYRPRTRHFQSRHACPNVVWFDELLDSESYGTSRGTGVLVRGAGGWKVAQYALTFPIPNDLAKEFTGRIKAHEAGARTGAAVTAP